MVFNRHIGWQDDDPKTRPSIDRLLLDRNPTVDYSKELGIGEWREIDTESDLIEEIKEDISDLVYKDGEGFEYSIPSNEYGSRLSEWMKEANNILHAIERDEKIHPEFLVQKGIALATIGAAEVKQQDPYELIIRAYEKKIETLKNYLTKLIDSLDVKIRGKYTDLIDELAKNDNRWEREIFKNNLIALKRTSYQTVISRWAEEAHDDDIYHMKDPSRRAAEILDRGLKIIQKGKEEGLANAVRENTDVFYDCLFTLSEIVGGKKGKQYERQYKAVLDME